MELMSVKVTTKATELHSQTGKLRQLCKEPNFPWKLEASNSAKICFADKKFTKLKNEMAEPLVLSKPSLQLDEL